jgi:tetratricopeptide (TPR) repeat protein
MAHNAYLQTAGEIGIPGVAFLALGSLLIIGVGGRSLRKRDFAVEHVEQPLALQPIRGRSGRPQKQILFAENKNPPPAYLIFAGADEKLLQCGLIAGFVGGLIQNMIDSDWYITFDGLTLWFLGGLILALASKSLPPPAVVPNLMRQVLSFATIAVAVILGVTLLAWGSAEATATIANEAVSRTGNTSAAYTSFRSATQLNPLNGSYFSTLGFKLDQSVDPAASEPDLRRAVELEPDGVNYRRYAKFLLAHDRPGDALTQLRAGIVVEPNNVDLWNLAAEAHLAQNDAASAIAAYEEVSYIETSPVGTIRAVTEIVDINYVDADLFLADNCVTHHNLTRALELYGRVEATLRAYATEGGTTNMMRMPTVGGHYDARVDEKQRTNYDHASAGLLAAARATHSGNPDAIEKQRTATLAAFDAIIATTSKTAGPTE